MNLLYGQVGNWSPPPSEEVVRMTTAPVDVTKPAAEMDDQPIMGEVETDSDPTLGMASRQLASDWHHMEKYSPFWAGNADQQAVNDVPVNSQVASSGTAAAREMSGQFGHGTMGYAVGIEPVQALSEGGQFGNTYFERDKPNIQDGSGSYMEEPPGYSHGHIAVVGRQGAANARSAANSSMYEAYLFGGEG